MFFALSVVRTVLRLGFPTDDAGTYYLLNGLASSVLEETARVIAFYYILKEYRNASDAVSHGIGHGALENLGAGITTIGLNMTAANAFLGCAGQLMGSCRHIALSVFAWYGVKKRQDKAYAAHSYGNTPCRKYHRFRRIRDNIHHSCLYGGVLSLQNGRILTSTKGQYNGTKKLLKQRSFCDNMITE